MSTLKKLIMAANQIDDDIIESLPLPYILCEYISCTRSQYIDLGYKLGYSDKIELDIHPELHQNTTTCSPFGYDNYSGGYGFDLTYGSSGAAVITFGNAINKSVKLSNDRCKISISKTGIWKNGTFHLWNRTPLDFTSDGNIYIGASHRTGGFAYAFSGKIHEVKVYQNGAMIHRYMPALNSDTMIAGLYDIVTGMFLPNTSNSTFGYLVKGSAIPYLEFTAIEDELQVSFSKNDIQYSLDRKEWITLPAGEPAPSVPKKTSIYFKANIVPDEESSGIGRFTCIGKYYLSGTPLSLLYGDECFGKSALPSVDYCFLRLFSETDVVRVLNPKEFLPVTTIDYGCYARMFQDCKYLENAVFLPALVLKGYSYYYMYSGCSSLTETFDFPAWTSLYLSEFSVMFKDCISLKKQPKITATIMNQSCCDSMFIGCTSLEDAQDFQIASPLGRAFSNMYKGCTSLVKAPSFDYVIKGTPGFLMNSIFENCAKLSTPPKYLKIVSLGGDTFASAFSGCTTLTESPVIQNINETDSASGSLSNMFRGCINLKKITYLGTKALGTTGRYSTNWVEGVASDGVIILNKNIDWNPDNYRGISGIPSNWTVKYCDPVNPEITSDNKNDFHQDTDHVEQSDCTTLNYLQTDGLQYIDSLITISGNSKIEIDATAPNITSANILFGSGYNSDNRIFINLGNGNDSISRFNGAVYTGNLYKAGRHTWAIDKNGVYIDGNKVGAWDTTPSEFVHQKSACIFAEKISTGTGVQNLTKANTKIHGLKIWNGETLEAELIPAFHETLQRPGLYDKVNQRFLTTRGIGDFTYE